jgi:hypothetical protein
MRVDVFQKPWWLLVLLVGSACGDDGSTGPEGIDLLFVALSTGTAHTCGLTTEGRAYCWGSNDASQLGADAVVVPLGGIPVAVDGGLLFASITAGAAHTCGIGSDAALRCWGTDLNGVIGVPTLLPGSDGIDQANAGSFHSCGVNGSGAAKCWGLGGAGQIGNGEFGSSALSPVPVDVSGQRQFTELFAGETHSCGIDVAGNAYCWGVNSSGQVGDGVQTSGPCLDAGGATFSCVLTPALVAGGISWLAITTGSRHACGIATDGSAHCWGDDRTQQLGAGGGPQTCGVENNTLPHAACSTAPIPVSSNLTWSAISAGGFHTCGLTDQGDAYCWGNGQLGQLGNGSDEVRGVPTEVAGGHRFAAITAGHLHTCAVTVADEAYCWGSNARGQLGNTEELMALEPVKVAAARF